MCRVLDQQVDKLFQKQDIEREKARIANGKSHITAFCKSVFEGKVNQEAKNVPDTFA